MKNLFKKKDGILNPTDEEKDRILKDMTNAMIGRLSPKCPIEVVEELAITFLVSVAYTIENVTGEKGELNRMSLILEGIADNDEIEENNNDTNEDNKEEDTGD